MNKKIIVVGGDGFCGWPLSLRLSNLGHDVCIVDNLSRRKIDIDLGSESLTPIQTIETRIATWKELTGKDIHFMCLDIANDYYPLCDLLRSFKPTTIIHLGEQRAAPYSMKNDKTKRYTVNNNLNGTHNLLCSITEVDQNIHLIHLGTMGVYGYGTIPDTVIPEGYIKVKMSNSKGEMCDVDILHPAYPGSIYHMTKTQDALFFQFYAKNYKLKITDLHQGIIWGQATKETEMSEKLINRFDYDSDYGTVLNRFIIQAACGIPMTIYGTGQQTRAFINIENSMDCIVLAIDNPPMRGDRVKIFNQITETKSLKWLTEEIMRCVKGASYVHIENPRKELVSNELVVSNDQFINLGLKPKLIDKQHIMEIYVLAEKYSANLCLSKVQPSSFW